MQKLRIIRKPWGEEHLFALKDRYAGKILIINKGHRLSLQYHNKKEETLYLLEGVIKLTTGKQRSRLKSKVVKKGCVFHLPAKTIHRMEAIETSHLVEVSTPELSDVVRLEDDYNRIKG